MMKKRKMEPMNPESIEVVSVTFGIVVTEEFDENGLWNYWFTFSEGMKQLGLVPMGSLRLTPPQRLDHESLEEIAMFVGRVRADTTQVVRHDKGKTNR
jgi:hypothetical protein